MRKPITLLIALSILIMIPGCSENDPLQPAAIDSALKAKDTVGNNLSFPVIWSDGYQRALRGDFGTESFLGASTIIDGLELFHQQDALNHWQAESASGLGAPVNVDWIDWGDNLEARPWPYRAKIRVEVVLYRDLEQPMLGYEMGWVTGLGVDEMWGATTGTYDSPQAAVYSHCARLTIQKLTADPAENLIWNPATGRWDGDAGEPFYNNAVWENEGEGPLTGYSAETNIKGKIIYGMLWDTKSDSDGEGIYRLTFSFDSQGLVALNTFFTDATQVIVSEEEGEKAEPLGGHAVVDHENNLTYIDVTIVPPTGGRGGGGGNRH
jgi:hypothetical protein